ncbi:hypothetical protein A7Q10_06595 [Methylacidiphilum caldifontis]|uniref:Uncharacterized protein n=1 Tax=Methylacidiphilum caldifontis TaxID=2795386 RepID=A0A4Y8PFJ4_9BACT|nr:hypothetical protein A7Q10_06595 [Methylacidiphilum caldifontis]
MKRVIHKAWNKQRNNKISAMDNSLSFKTLRKPVLKEEKEDPLNKIIKKSIQQIIPPVCLKENVIEAIKAFEDYTYR